ncbi:uncharacterized protein LOC106161228 [Lingula anatina]|uniref:Uncharacterized protein LOC106161228 n=1 Tax=Lingula anatina TaxID=7574 RepID=A0A1S3I5Q1_LINAN|nr:uncharacterized protein LOC106161228 [Lingula anatina]|eukprot:XP_013393577.1 uncharacterized protein LOC106161228 [Lingula anatina]
MDWRGIVCPRNYLGSLIRALLLITILFFLVYGSLEQRCKEPGTNKKDIAIREFLSKGESFQRRSGDIQLPVEHVKNVTVVTAFFSLGNFIKGTLLRREDFYQQNAGKIAMVRNPLIFYTNSPEIAQQITFFRRSYQPSLQTDVIIMNINDSWAFGLRPRIQAIFNQDGYPKYHPQTINANYSVAMHAKYEVMADAIKSGRVRTTHVCWMDFGIWRNEEGEGFEVGIPNDVIDGQVAYTEIEANSNPTPRNIVYLDMVWVVGAFFIGRVEAVQTFCTDYRRGVHWMIKHFLMSTDQQVIYTLYSKHFKLNPRVHIQTYRAPPEFSHSPWYYLAYRCRRALH